MIFDKIETEMNKILILCAIIGLFADAPAYSAVRDGGASARPTGNNTARTSSTRDTQQNGQTNTRTATTATRNTAARAGALRVDNTGRPVAQNVKSRAATVATANTPRRTIQVGRAAVMQSTVPSNEILETRTGAAYARCKSAYFQCMDQFCQLKNDDYRRCSCSARVYDLGNVRQNIIDTNNKLTEFTENLDAVGLTAAQATAIHTASDGENALAADTSASKALLTAIMNSIRGGDTTVGGKMSDLNSINLSFDTVNMFGLGDPAAAVASYNGTELYNAVYPSCRSAVAADCNDASLQRAVTAYLMAIEQDCNTVQSALESKQKDLRAAVREGSAMLDLARIENRNKHNSDDMATCIGNVESAVLSEEVCGANYHKCLDNGEFIDVTTGAPITGVVRFYELQNLLKFDSGKDASMQKLAQNPNNSGFVKNFESKTKKFAEGALDKCTEIADSVWSEYLDKALLDIYYAQKAKVQTIKTGCFDLISQCYDDRETAITAAMTELIDGTSEISLIPDKIVLTREMCKNYIDSCNNMFDNTDIVAEYVDNQTDTDTTTACRAVVQQCFDSFGGTNYENFYYPASGLFQSGFVDTLVSETSPQYTSKELSALDWFSLYEYDDHGNRLPGYKSKCAQRVAEIDSCKDKVEQVFGGLDAVIAGREIDTYGQYTYVKVNNSISAAYAYGWAKLHDGDETIPWGNNNYEGPDKPYKFKNRRLRPTGVATEVYNQIIDTLTTQCMNVNGKFIEAQFIDHGRYGVYANHTLCQLHGNFAQYGIYTGYAENMCPKNYTDDIDTHAWGICSCWENGGRRSKDGKFSKCSPVIPGLSSEEINDFACPASATEPTSANNVGVDKWCTSAVYPATNQVCPFGYQNIITNTEDPGYANSCGGQIPHAPEEQLPDGITNH